MNSPAQRQIDDVTLSAWIDQALDAAEMSAVSKALQQQPTLQARLTAMLCNDRKLQRHYAQMAQQSMPTALQELLFTDSSAQQHPQAEHQRKATAAVPAPWQERLLHWLDGMLPRPLMAAAAMLAALGLGLMLGQQVSSPDSVIATSPMLVTSDIPTNHPLHALLESSVAGTRQSLDAHINAMVELTFQNSNEDYCRQFRVDDVSSGRGNIAVACRQLQGWQLQLAQTGPAAMTAAGEYQAASGPETALIDRYIMDHSVGDIMLGAAEQELILRGWQATNGQ